jgi:two-component sensor histidine kinase
MNISRFISLFLILSCDFTFSQSNRVDGTKQQLKTLQADTSRINLLLETGKKLSYGLPQDSAKSVPIKGIEQLLQAKKLSESIHSQQALNKSLCALGSYYYFIKKPDSARLYYLQVIRYHTLHNQLYAASEIWDKMAGATPSIEETVNNLYEALKIYQKLKLPEKEAICHKTIGETYLIQEKFQQAEKELLIALQIQRSINYQRLHDTYGVFVELYETQRRYPEAFKYAMMALESIQETHDNERIPDCYKTIANLYFAIREPEKAQSYILKTYDYYLHQNNTRQLTIAENQDLYDVVRALNGRYYLEKKPGTALSVIRKTYQSSPPRTYFSWYLYYYALGDYYTTIGDIGQAETQYLKALKYATLNKGPDFILEMQFRLASFYMQFGQFHKAAKMLNILFANKKHLSPLIKRGIYSYQYKIDSANGNWGRAFQNFRNFQALNDSIFSEKKKLEIKEVQYNYQRAGQEKIISLQKAALENASETHRFILAIIALLILILGLVYNGYRLKMRSNKRLTAKNSEIDEQNFLLKKALQAQTKLAGEKEWLMKELNHRVKNNLQIIISLLNFQTRFLKAPDAKNAIMETQHRIYSMSLIHQKLYQSGNNTSMEIKGYIADLVEYLKTSLAIRRNITVLMDITETELDVSYAIPLGIIITEAIVNAVKHAFPDERSGQIEITLIADKADIFYLTIKDNGIGLKDGINLSKNKSLGVSLIKSFCDQLEAKCSFNNNEGLTIAITFKHETPVILNY